MTAQFHDTVTYEDHDYDLVGVKGAGLFDPGAHGFTPKANCTACWRGYMCMYAVASDQLVLHTLRINLAPDQSPPDSIPALFHGVPRAVTGPLQGRVTDSDLFDSSYPGVDWPVPFTGGLLLADDFIGALYVHMGFHPAWKYRTVHELIFDAGSLTEARDVSSQLAAARERMIHQPLKPERGVSKDEIGRWVDECFSLDYTRID